MGRGELNSELGVHQPLALDFGQLLASVSPSAQMDSWFLMSSKAKGPCPFESFLNL